MCEQCSAATVEVGEFAPGWKLVRATRDGRVMKPGQYALLQGNDPTYYLDVTPIPAPPGEAGHDAEWDAFFGVAEQFMESLKSYPEPGYDLVSACLKVGYMEDGYLPLLGQWLCDRLGRMIAGMPERGPEIDKGDGR